jgi:excisionase family DNA binding protein
MNTMNERNAASHSNQDPLLSRAQAAAYLGLSPRTLAIWATTKRYDLKMVKIGRLAKYRRSDLDAFIASRRGY